MCSYTDEINSGDRDATTEMPSQSLQILMTTTTMMTLQLLWYPRRLRPPFQPRPRLPHRPRHRIHRRRRARERDGGRPADRGEVQREMIPNLKELHFPWRRPFHMGSRKHGSRSSHNLGLLLFNFYANPFWILLINFTHFFIAAKWFIETHIEIWRRKILYVIGLGLGKKNRQKVFVRWLLKVLRC